MKFVIVLLAAIGFAAAAPRQSVQADNLRPALEQLLENVDVAKLLALIPQLAETQDGQELLAYLRGADFGRAIDAVKAEPVTDVLLGYLESNGLENVRQAIKDLGAALGIPSRPFALPQRVGTKSLSDLIDQLLSVIDVDGLLEDLLTLVASDPAVTNLLAFLSSDEVEAGYLRLKANSAILAVTARLRQEGVDVDAIIALIEGLLGYGRKNVQADNLRPALEQLLENVDIAKLLALIPQLAETQDGQELLAYLRGADFGRAIDAVKAEPVTDVLLGYLESNGLENVRQAIKDLGAALGIPSRPFALPQRVGTKSLSDLIDQLLSVIDVDGLLEDLLTLVASDPAVTNLLAFLSSDEVEAGYLRLKANSAILAVTARLRQEGVDVDAIIALIEGLLGYGRKNSVRADNLRPALEQLLENVDIAKLLALIPQLAETQDGQELLAYLRGADFGRAIDAVKAEPVTDVLLGYLESNGLENVRQAIKDLGAALGIPSRPFALFHQASTKSLSDLIDELLSVIDVDGLLEDLLTLVASDPAVTNLLAFLSSDEVEAGYLRLKANSAILAVTARLRQEGVDVDAIIALIEGLLGYGRRA